MKNYISIDGKKTELSDSTADNLKKDLSVGGSRYRKVVRKGVLLTDEEGRNLVETWSHDIDLNDFDYFDRVDTGHLWISPQGKVEILNYDGEVLLCTDEKLIVRFLK